MKKSVWLLAGLFLMHSDLYASRYLLIEDEKDLPIVSNNVRHFLDTEKEIFSKISKSKTFSEEDCKKVIIGNSFLMVNFRNNPNEFKEQLKAVFKYIANNKKVVADKIEKNEIDSNFLQGLWFLHKLTSQVK